MRLLIAAESAGALAYLHTSCSSPIYHRDIKSANILLDDKYRAKISDFGIANAITIDQTHVTTCVQGTYGYLDPEYFQSNPFTEKSDVYSYGVVLVELITGKKPTVPTNSGGWISLASEFLSHMENSSLDGILDSRVLEERNKEEFMAIANLARQCLKRNGKRRPTMKEVAMVLEGIRSQHVPSVVRVLIFLYKMSIATASMEACPLSVTVLPTASPSRTKLMANGPGKRVTLFRFSSIL